MKRTWVKVGGLVALLAYTSGAIAYLMKERRAFLPLFVILLVIFAGLALYDMGCNQIDNMTGVEFEKFVAEKLKRKGYNNVKMTPTSGDYGVDIIATKGRKIYAFQCKRYKGSVGVHAVQEVYAGCKKYGADRPVVVTNSKYTKRAKRMADDLGVSLWSLEMLDAIFDD